MKPKNLLIRLAKPATVEVHERLSDLLDNGARGGFHPFGMWDYIIDSNRLDWCGVQYYLASETLKMFESSNPGVDGSIIRFRKVEDVFKPEELDQSTIEPSHVLQVVWSEPSKIEILPAMEFTDFWYASLGKREIEQEDRFVPSHNYRAVGILGVESKLERMGFNLPHEFLIPFVDRNEK
jgi:hypothetical protein